MASPPFSIAETTPGDDDVVLLFPALERTFRDVVESWLLIEHDTYGHHKLPSLTSTERDADTNWSVGALIYNETLKTLQFATGADPEVWHTVGFDTGTRVLFQQTNAPTGWTKESSSTYNDVMMRFTTGAVATGGSVAASAAFVSQAVSGTVDAHTLTTAEMPAHTHAAAAGNFYQTVAGTGPAAIGSGTGTMYSSNLTGSTGGGGSHTHGFTGTAINLAVKYASVIIATKD